MAEPASLSKAEREELKRVAEQHQYGAVSENSVFNGRSFLRLLADVERLEAIEKAAGELRDAASTMQEKVSYAQTHARQVWVGVAEACEKVRLAIAALDVAMGRKSMPSNICPTCKLRQNVTCPDSWHSTLSPERVSVSLPHRCDWCNKPFDCGKGCEKSAYCTNGCLAYCSAACRNEADAGGPQ